MPSMRSIKVLVVDDSPMVRRHLCSVFNEAGMITETASNGRECLDKISEFKPQVITLDINMPVMGGIECLQQIMHKRFTPVIVISSLTKRNAAVTLHALELGAVDYIPKPEGGSPSAMEQAKKMLVTKVYNASQAKQTHKLVSAKHASSLGRNRASDFEKSRPSPTSAAQTQTKIVLIGVSTGGPVTLQKIIPELPASFPVPIVVAQHMPARFTSVFSERLNKLSSLTVKELSNAQTLVAGTAYIAQGDANIEMYKEHNKVWARPNTAKSKHIWRPSITHLVESAMLAMPANQLCLVQLTGMGNDGASMMAKAQRQGAFTIAESEETCQVYGMPKALIKLNGASKILPDYEIAKALISLHKLM